MDFGIALTAVAAASPRASKQPRRWNLRTGAEAEERVATCGLAPCNHAGHSWAGIVPADTNALVELNGSLGAARQWARSPSLFGGDSTDSSHRLARRPEWPPAAAAAVKSAATVRCAHRRGHNESLPLLVTLVEWRGRGLGRGNATAEPRDGRADESLSAEQ